jgi:hypothetical protein
MRSARRPDVGGSAPIDRHGCEPAPSAADRTGLRAAATDGYESGMYSNGFEQENAKLIAFNQSIGADVGATVLGATTTQGAISQAHDQSIDVYESGWARIEFNHPSSAAGTSRNYLISEEGIATIGLHSIGFRAADFLNSNIVAGVRGSFGLAHHHRWSSDGYAGATDPGFASATSSPLPLNAAGLASWTTTIGP